MLRGDVMTGGMLWPMGAGAVVVAISSSFDGDFVIEQANKTVQGHVRAGKSAQEAEFASVYL